MRQSRHWYRSLRDPLWFGAGVLSGALGQRILLAEPDEPSPVPVPVPAVSPIPPEQAERPVDSRSAKRRLVPSSRTVASTVLGVGLVAACFWLYQGAVQPPRSSTARGEGTLYVQDPAVVAQLSVRFLPDDHAQPGSKVSVDLTFTSQRQIASVAWAFVLTDDACLSAGGRCLTRPTSDVALPEGAALTATQLGRPPLSANPRTTPSQIIRGTTKMDTGDGHVGVSIITGRIRGDVAVQSGETWNLRLPGYGRLAQSPALNFADQPGALDLGVPGVWRRPTRFEVDVEVDSPANDATHRVDNASPPLPDPSVLQWQSADSVRTIVQRTDLQREANQQVAIFVLGAAVGAGAALVLGFFEWGLGGVFSLITARASRSSRAAQEKPARAD